jgi:hypothetical protein
MRMSTPRHVLFGIVVATLLALPAVQAASLFAATSGGVTDLDPAFASINNGFTDNFSTGSWTGEAVASGDGVGVQLFLGAGNSATYQFVCGQNACTVVNAAASSADNVRITPTGLAPAGTPVNIRFDLTLDGSVVGYGGYNVSASGNAGTGTAVSYSNSTGGTVGAFNFAVHEVMSFNRTFLVGTTYSLSTSLSMGALMRGIGPGPYGIDVDFLDTLIMQGTVLSSGLGPLQLLGESGRDYFLTPVPVPAAGWLLGTGLLALSRVRRKNRRR